MAACEEQPNFADINIAQSSQDAITDVTSVDVVVAPKRRMRPTIHGVAIRDMRTLLEEIRKLHNNEPNPAQVFPDAVLSNTQRAGEVAIGYVLAQNLKRARSGQLSPLGDDASYSPNKWPRRR